MLRAIVILIVLSYSATALATTPDVDLVLDVGQWSEADRTSIIRGAEAVPAAIRKAVGPIRVARGEGRCPFAMGAYNRTCPTYTTDGAFLVYDPLPVQGQGPPSRLAVLNDLERRDLLFRRAIVHAFVVAADVRWRWSEEPAWRRLNFWRPGADQPFNRDPWGFSRYLGMRSAHLDLVTFAEEYFVRPEAVLAESTSPGVEQRIAAFDADLSMQCQEFSRLRFLWAKLRSVAPGWTAPEDPRELRTGCTAFDAWASLATIEGIDVLLAAATADRPQSLWGHLLVHIRHRDRTEGFEPVYQFGAVVSSDIDPVEYVTRGLMGGYVAVLDPYDYREIDRAVLRTEQRSLKRYRLQLSDEQTLRVLQRIWEMERRTRLPYWFFDENCAAFLADLLQSALTDLAIAPRSDFIVAPTDVLDHLAAIDNPPHGPLLRKLPEESLSNRQRARWARARRAEVLDALRGILGESGRARLDRAVDGLGSVAAVHRAASYEAVAVVLSELVSEAPGERARLVGLGARLLDYNVEVERYYLESKITQANDVWARARSDYEAVTDDVLLARRRSLYLHEDLEHRRAQRLAWDAQELADFQIAERRALRDSEQRLVAEQSAAREAFAVAVAGRRRFFEAHAVDTDRLRQSTTAELVEHRRQVDERSIGRSGKERASLGLSTLWISDEASMRLDIGFAFLDERLGSQRTRGFRPDIETKVFDLRLHVPLVGDAPSRPALDLVLLRYLSIEQLLQPARRSWLGVFGYGFDITVTSDPTIGVDWSAEGSGGLLLPIATSAEMVSHFVVGLFPMVRHVAGGDDELTFGGTWLFSRAQMHLFGNFANVLRLDARVAPSLELASLKPTVIAAANLAMELHLGEVRQRPLTFVVHGGGERTGARLDEDADQLRWTAGLRLESAL